jgi:hypothetical protein
MQLRYFFLMAIVVAYLAARPTRGLAAGTVEATCAAELSTDPGFEGLWKYTVDMTWDLEAQSVGHLDIFLDVTVFDDTCSSSSVVFPLPAGASTGINAWGNLCNVEYIGEFLCKDDPSLKEDSLGYTVKYEPIEVNCQTDVTGTGTFYFYTGVAPGLSGFHEDAIAIKHGSNVDFGGVEGELPLVDGFRETGLALINEFLVKPPPGGEEFVEIFNPTQDTVDVTGWEIVINDSIIVPLQGIVPPDSHKVDSTFITPVIIDFDTFPFSGAPIPSGTIVNFTYTDQGVIFSRNGGTLCGTGSDVYANENQPAGFGSSPNVVTTCPDGIASDISEGGGFGVITAGFSDAVKKVCIDVDPVGPGHRAFLRVYGGDFVFIDEVLSDPGVRQTLCYEAPTEEIWAVEFSGYDSLFARFDNLLISPPPPPFIIEGKGSPLATNSTQQNGEENGEDFVPDKGGIIVLVDDDGVVQDSVAYGNQGGAPISGPLLVLAGTEPPPGFMPPGYVAAEDETLSTSTQRILDGQDTGSDADDFNVGSPTPDQTNNPPPPPIQGAEVGLGPDGGRRDPQLRVNTVPPPALGSSVRLNSIYAFGTSTDGIGLYNPTDATLNIAGWHLSDGSIIEPVLSGSGDQPLAPDASTDLVQNSPQSFTFELEPDDVLYLYDQNLVRLDQLGWTRVPTFFPDSCILRNPDGAGPADGYDWNTSGGLDGTLIYDDCALKGGTVAIVPQGMQFRTSLAAPYPNPARGASTISFTIGGSSEDMIPAEVTIYDVAGRRVRTLISGEFKPGIYRAVWNGLLDSGSRTAAGVYFVRMRVGEEAYGNSRSIVWLK